jgi:hypothetical protein
MGRYDLALGRTPEHDPDRLPPLLEDCLCKLAEMHSTDLNQWKEMPERQAIGVCHHGLGQQIRNDWGLWGESTLSKFFNRVGIHHPDDMSGIILTSYHRRLNGRPIDLEGQIQHYKDYWAKEENRNV